MAEVSPAEPATEPASRSSVSVARCSNFCSASGVAPVKPSIACSRTHSEVSAGDMNGSARVEGMNSMNRPGAKAGVQVVMATGKAACTKARPTRAGFITL